MSRLSRFVVPLIVLLLSNLFLFSGIAYATNYSFYASGRILIKYRPGVDEQRKSSIEAAARSRVDTVYPSSGWQRVRIPPDMSVGDAIDYFSSRSDVECVEPDYVCNAKAVPNDPSYSSQWGLAKISAPTAWNSTIGDQSVVVAVVDTGVYYTHEDLSANMWKNPGEIPGNGIDDDHNGYVDDVYGIDTYNHDSDPFDDNGHGTHCAGIIGAVGGNAKGITGVNWSVKILPVKFMGANGSGYTSGAIEALEYLTDLKNRGINVRVANHSWGSSAYSQALKDALDAAGEAGILNCCAAGNGGSDGVGDNCDITPEYPSGFNSDCIISVAASDSSDNKTGFSNYGATTVDLAAPGSLIYSTYKGSNTAYTNLSGTSMATPFVTGAAALLLSRTDSLSVSALKTVLLNSVDVLPQWAGKTVTGGRLNIAKAMDMLNAAPTQPDLMIKKADETDYLGNGVYDDVDGQSKSKTTSANNPAVYYIKLQNDGGEQDDFIIKGDTGASGWTVRYYDAQRGGNDVTSAVTGSSGWVVNLEGFAYQEFRVEVNPGAGVTGGAEQQVQVNVASSSDESKTDAVQTITSKAETLSTVSLADNPTPKSVVSTAVALTATSTGGFNVQYKFRAGYLSGSSMVWSTLRDYSTSRTYTWTPSSAKAYTIEVWAREVGSTKEYDVKGTLDHAVVAAASSVTLAADPAPPVLANVPITLTATAVGGVNLEYQFKVADASTSATVIRDFASSKTCTWTPTSAKTYTLSVYVREKGATATISKTLSYVVSPAVSAVTLAGSPVSPTATGMDVLLTATSTGGANLEYEFRQGVIVDGNTTWTTIRAFGTTKTCTWTPTDAGSYSIEVRAREVGHASAYEAKGNLAYTVASPISAVDLSASPASPQVAGKDITLSATPTGGGTVQYKFRAGKVSGSSTSWSTLREYNTASTYTWKPTAGTYTVEVWARESGKTCNYDVIKSISYTVAASISAVNLTASPVSPVYENTPVSLSATKTGGLNVEYRFRSKVGTSTTWTILRSYDSTSTYTWTPTSAGSYTLEVGAREVGSTKDYDVVKTLSFLVSKTLSAVKLSSNLASPMSASIPITLTATPTGGATLSYKFRAGKVVDGTTTWSLIRDFGTSASCTWTPSSAGTYVVEVTAKDVVGSNPIQVTDQIDYTVGSALTAASLSVTPVSPALVNTILTLTGDSTGGVNVEYQFRVGSTVIKAYGSEKICLWTANSSGSKTLTVDAREKGTTKVVSKSLTYSISPLLSAVRLTSNPATSTSVGIGVLLTATPTGGLRPEYQFRVGDTVVRDFSTVSNCTWTPFAAGTYQVEVRAREAGKTNAYDVLNSFTFTVAQALSAVNLAPSLTSSVPTNTNITLTATKTGGANVLYKFQAGYLSGSTMVWSTIKDFSSTNTCTWKPTAAKSYTLQVLAKESGSSKTYDVSASIDCTIVAAISAITLTASPVSPSQVNKAITLTAAKTGGINIEYQFQVKQGTGSYSTIKSYSSSSTVTWTPNMAGTYTFIVYAREVGTTSTVNKTLTCVVNP